MHRTHTAAAANAHLHDRRAIEASRLPYSAPAEGIIPCGQATITAGSVRARM